MRVSLVRHGKAQYRNVASTTDRENATDLVPESIESLRMQAADFVSGMRDEDMVTIWSSPIPRALETSKIFEEVLRAAGKDIRKVGIFDVFEEARGFKWEYLSALVNGGTVEVGGVMTEVDVRVSNPEKLSVSEYFRKSAWNEIPDDGLRSFGPFGKAVSSMESYSEIVERVTDAIGRLRNLHGKAHHLLIFTHQCCTDFVIEAVNDYEKGGIDPGDSVTLEIKENNICVIETPFGNGNVDDLIKTTKERQSKML